MLHPLVVDHSLWDLPLNQNNWFQKQVLFAVPWSPLSISLVKLMRTLKRFKVHFKEIATLCIHCIEHSYSSTNYCETSYLYLHYSEQTTWDIPAFCRKLMCVNPFIPLAIDFHGLHTLTFSIFISVIQPNHSSGFSNFKSLCFGKKIKLKYVCLLW